MPELPEVETIRKTLQPWLSGRKITEAVFRRDDMIEVCDGQHPPEGAMCDSAESFCTGSVIQEIDRRGKYLLLRFSEGGGWAVHFGMSGSMFRADKDEPVDKHTHVVWSLDDGGQVRYRAPRRFGKWVLTETDPVCALTSRVGVDALDNSLDADEFKQILNGSRRRIKARLLDQRLIAGLGNIYADEALFGAGVHPARRTDSLRAGEWGNLFEATRAVLLQAVEHCGTTFNSFRDGCGRPGENEANLRVYGRGGEGCLRCSEKIRKIRLEGRGTHFCPGCQSHKSVN